jgi:hypothetical protein
VTETPKTTTISSPFRGAFLKEYATKAKSRINAIANAAISLAFREGSFFSGSGFGNAVGKWSCGNWGEKIDGNS